MILSVHIATRNRAQELDRTLRALEACTIPEGCRLEVVIVNNGSSDHTKTVIENHSGFLPVLYQEEPRAGLARARNRGLSVSHADFVIFTDDDVTPDPGWLAAYAAGFRAHPAGYYFGGPIRSSFDSPEARQNLLDIPFLPHSVKGLDWGQKEGNLGPIWFIGLNWGCSMKLLRQAGFFTESLGPVEGCREYTAGEETELMRRLRALGARPYYLPRAGLSHRLPASELTLSNLGSKLEAISLGNFIPRNGFEKRSSLFLFFKKINLLVETARLRRQWRKQKKSSSPQADRTYLHYRLKYGQLRAIGLLAASRSSGTKERMLP